MHRYIQQLITDFRQATWRIHPPHEIWNGTYPDDEMKENDIHG